MSGHLSSDRHDWQTPEYFLDLVRQVAPIGLDPCAPLDATDGEALSSNPIRARDCIVQTRAYGCGLSMSWATSRGEIAFVNPPYGAHLGGPVEPAYQHWKKSKDGTRELVGIGRGWARKIISEAAVSRIALVPARPDAQWWGEMLRASTSCLLWRSPEHGARIRFKDAATGKLVNGNNSPSTVFLFSDDSGMRARFADVFRAHGELVRAENQVQARWL